MPVGRSEEMRHEAGGMGRQQLGKRVNGSERRRKEGRNSNRRGDRKMSSRQQRERHEQKRQNYNILLRDTLRSIIVPGTTSWSRTTARDRLVRLPTTYPLVAGGLQMRKRTLPDTLFGHCPLCKEKHYHEPASHIVHLHAAQINESHKLRLGVLNGTSRTLTGYVR